MADLSSYTVTIGVLEDLDGKNYIPNAPIEIKERLSNGSSGSLSLIFSDQAGTVPITQTGATANALGQFTFFAAAAQYNAVYDNDGTPVTIAVDVGVTGDILSNVIDKLNPDTIALALADLTLDLTGGESLNVKEYSAGNGGGALWETIVGTGSADGLFILAHDTLNLSLVYRERDEGIFAGELGIISGSGQTTEIATFLEHIHDNKLLGVMLSGQYDVDASLLTKATNGKFKLVCQDGEAIFNYTGVSEIVTLIQSTNCDHVLMKNITFENNNLVNRPLDLRKSSAFGGIAGLFNVNSHDAKEIASVDSAVGLQLSGSFAKVQFIGCTVDGVTYTTLGRDATGIVLSNFAGICEVNLCNIKNITTPEDVNADGLKIFGDDVATITTRLAATAEIHNSIFMNCEDRFIKLQISNFEIHGCQFLLDNNFSTITQWRGIDAQTGGGNIHHNNFVFGTGITWGSAANIVTFQNLRNDGTEQVSMFQHNTISNQTAGLDVMVNLSAEYGDNSIVICNNPVLGATIEKGFALRVGDGTNSIATAIANTDSVSVEYCDNAVQDYSGQDVFSLFDTVDYGDTVYLKIKNNKVKNITSISRLTPASPGWTINHNFTISNNIHTSNQVYWTFDIDFVYGENDFVVGTQTIGGTGPGLGNTVYYSVQGGIQRAYNTGGTLESRRTTSAPNAWFAWTAV